MISYTNMIRLNYHINNLYKIEMRNNVPNIFYYQSPRLRRLDIIHQLFII